MITQDILTKFELIVDESSELSDAEELDLANDVYGDICDDRDWEWLKATATGTTSTTVPYVALPADFKKVAPNEYNKSVVFVGSDYQPYEVISFADRRNHRDEDGYCYIDIPNQRLYFTLQPTEAKAIEYDYIKIAPDLDLLGATPTGSNPLFRAGFHPIISYGMAAKFPMMEQSEKDKSYAREYLAEYLNILSMMRREDAEIKLSL
jgi:hypothetical protein